jgi:hypothetical protein
MAEIETIIASRMESHAGLTALISTRSYNTLAPERVAKPYVVWTPGAIERIKVAGGSAALVKTSIDVDVYAATADSRMSVSAQLRSALDGWSTTSGAPLVQRAYLIDQEDSYEEDTKLYRRWHRMEVWYEEA